MNTPKGEGQIEIPAEFKKWYVAEARKYPTSEAYKEWKRRGQHLCYEVAYSDGYEEASEAAYRHLSPSIWELEKKLQAEYESHEALAEHWYNYLQALRDIAGGKAAPQLIAQQILEKYPQKNAATLSIDREGWEEKYHVANLLLEEHKKLIHAAAPYLRDMEADNAHDPSVGMYKDQKLTELVKDLESYVYLNQPFPDRYPRWVKAAERLPLHKAHWNTPGISAYYNEFPVRMNGRYAMANIFDQRTIHDGPTPKYMLQFERKDHYENEFSEIEWLEEQPSESPAITDK